MMPKILSILWVSLCLCGCFELEQTVSLHKDGTALVTFLFTVDNDMMSTLDNVMNVKYPHSKEAFDRDLIRQMIESNGRGMELRSYKKKVEGNQTVTQVMVLVKDYEKAFVRQKSNLVIEKTEAGTRLEIACPGVQDWVDSAQIDQMKELFKGMKMTLKIETPDDILETTGLMRGKRSAVWHFSADESAICVFGKIPPMKVSWKK